MPRRSLTAWLLRQLGAPDTSRRRLLGAGAGSMLIKAGATALGFAISLVLARALGPADFGLYSFAYAVAMVLAIPAQVGLPQLVVRETARAQATNQWGLMRGLWRWSSTTVLSLSAAIGLVALLILVPLHLTATPKWRAVLLALPLIPIVALGALRAGALRGLRHVVVGQLPERIIRPVLFLLAIFITVVLLHHRLTPFRALGLHEGAAFLGFVAGAVLLWRARPRELRQHRDIQYDRSHWRRATLPMALIGGFRLIIQYTDLLMLGALRPNADVGVYRVVAQAGTLVVFGLQAVAMVTMPHFARLHTQGDRDGLQRLTTLAARATLVFALPFGFAFIMFGHQLLGFAFGAAYAVGGTALAITAAGQLVSASMGNVGSLLNMTGHERETARTIGIAAFLNVVLNAALIPAFGITGAAIATATAVALWNIILRNTVRRRLGIESMAFSLRRRH